MLTPISGDSVDLYVGSRWVLVLQVTDDGGSGVGELPSVTVLLPDGDTEDAVAESLGNGFYRVAFTVTEPGLYLVTAQLAGFGLAAFRASVQSLADPLGNMPDLAAVKLYLGDTSTSDATIQDALNAETAAQMRVCRIPVVYPPDLAQALKRRVARNLALQGIPLAVLQGDAQTGNLTLPGKDPEVRRFEASYRKLVQP